MSTLSVTSLCICVGTLGVITGLHLAHKKEETDTSYLFMLSSRINTLERKLLRHIEHSHHTTCTCTSSLVGDATNSSNNTPTREATPQETERK